MSFELPDLNSFAADDEAMLNQFEEQGAVISRPVLPEGKYPANLKELSVMVGIGENKKTKEPQAWARLNVSFILNSASARESLKSDTDSTVFAEPKFLPMFLQLDKMGFSVTTNYQLWAFVGSVLEQVGLARLKEDSGQKSYIIDRNIVEAIYNDEYKDLRLKLYTKASNGESVYEEDDKLDNPIIIPALLAQKLINNLSTLLVMQEETRECAVEISRMEDYRSKELVHRVTGYILSKDIPAIQDELLV